MFLLPGLLLVVEAWTYRRGSFGRVSEDVRVALQQPWGRLILVVAAVGLAAFAAYELAAAAYRREPPDDDAVGLVPPKPSVRRLWTVALILLGGAAGLWGGLPPVPVRLLLAASPAALAATKRLLADVVEAPRDDVLLAATAKCIADARVSPDGREGIAAFLEKRAPAWAPAAPPVK